MNKVVECLVEIVRSVFHSIKFSENTTKILFAIEGFFLAI